MKIPKAKCTVPSITIGLVLVVLAIYLTVKSGTIEAGLNKQWKALNCTGSVQEDCYGSEPDNSSCPGSNYSQASSLCAEENNDYFLWSMLALLVGLLSTAGSVATMYVNSSFFSQHEEREKLSPGSSSRYGAIPAAAGETEHASPPPEEENDPDDGSIAMRALVNST